MTNIRSIVVSFAFMAAVAAPGLAAAQGMTEAPEPRLWLGGHLGLSPIGTLKAKLLDTSMSFDAETAFEIGGHLDVQLTPLLSIGFAPAVLFHVKSSEDSDSASQLDLPIRLTVGGNVAPKLRVYGFGAPGYTILFPPSDSSGNSMHPSGFMIGFGGGVAFKVAPKIAVTGELGYQFRFVSETQQVVNQSVDISLQDNFLTFSVGVMAGL